MGKRTHEEFIKLISTKSPNIKILGKYINAKSKIHCRCKIDNYEWTPTPDHLLSGEGCPMCAKIRRNQSHKKKTHEQFIQACNEKTITLK